MKLVNPSYEILEQGPGLEGIYEAIERSGRTCYKSQAKYQYRNPHNNEVYSPDFISTFATGDSKIGVTTTAEDFYNQYGVFIKESTTAKDFVDRMIASKHYAMLEHGTVYLKFSTKVDAFGREIHTWFPKGNYKYNPYSREVSVREELEPETDWQKEFFDKMNITHYYITTNMRVLVENGWLDDLQYLCNPTEFHEKRITVRFTTDRGVSHEFVRHRVFSFAQESTRYCNYSKDKFGNEITFIIPSWAPSLQEDVLQYSPFEITDSEIIFMNNCHGAETHYLGMLSKGRTPQEARQVLPNALKTELVMTGFVSDWQHFFSLRTSIIAETGKPHPDASALADPLYNEFISRGYMEPLV